MTLIDRKLESYHASLETEHVQEIWEKAKLVFEDSKMLFEDATSVNLLKAKISYVIPESKKTWVNVERTYFPKDELGNNSTMGKLLKIGALKLNPDEFFVVEITDIKKEGKRIIFAPETQDSLIFWTKKDNFSCEYIPAGQNSGVNPIVTKKISTNESSSFYSPNGSDIDRTEFGKTLNKFIDVVDDLRLQIEND